MANVQANVSTGKPKATGAIFRAPLGTTLPTSAVAPLDAAFKCLGFISEDGVTDSLERETEDKKAWGGKIVNSSQTSFSDKFKWTMIEAMNPEVLKTVFGDNNVVGDSVDTGIAVSVNSDEPEECCWVIDTILKGNIARRLVIPCGKGFSSGDIQYIDNEPIGYEIEVKAMPDVSGNNHYEYTQKSSACAITAFSLASTAGTINESLKTIAVEVPHGTSVTALIATFTLSEGATAKVGSTSQVSGVTSNNFTSPVSYVITAADGETTATYTVTVTVAEE